MWSSRHQPRASGKVRRALYIRIRAINLKSLTMIEIHDLPDELVLRLSEHLPPDDIKAFSCTAKRMRALSSRRLYKAVILSDGVEGGIDHPIKLLYDIWKNPPIATCIRYITFVCGDRYNFDASRIDDETRDIIRYLHGAEDFLRSSLYFYNHERERRKCLDGILAGREAAAFALLLVLLPNLERLRFSSPCWDKELLSSMFRFSAPPDPGSTRLSKLSTVESYHSDTEGEVPIDDLLLFALAPSIRTLRGTVISGDTSSISSIPGWQTAVSRLECLKLSAGAIEPEAVKALLLPMRSLRELRYCHNCYSPEGEPFEINTWVDSLTESVSNTLEVLSLTNPEGATTTVKSFKAFSVRIETDIF